MTAVKLFPTIEEVFVDNYEKNNQHFLPIASIDLSIIDKSLSGNIHLVYFNNDPYCDESIKHCNEFCDEDKVTFDMIDNKYRLKADYCYFSTNEDWIKYLEEGRKSYEENRKVYHQKNNLKINEVIKNLGEQPEWQQGDEWPTNLQGEKMIFICQVWSHDFIQDSCAEEIFLFYDKSNNLAVQIHQID
ncbi:hypothetical protein DVR12_20665 [Chitinophaga silvatica]|uniref:DUF1963 domain-containing protein n=1 Tax=Chitinophaga silvatica TaxID=2282649 RepID=A0A3E1Y5X8_9BACT|nr:hypothetical protein [Chitinophaga silvatica]RFS20131.1 hypothetical protein DVR12_20665 [Chitinophaga silvatica]